MMQKAAHLFLSLISVSVLSGFNTLQSQDTADVIYAGGSILTMEGDSPSYVEAVAVSGGRIVFAGSAAEAMKRRGPATVVRDLDGSALLPGFIDCHGHIEAAGYDGLWGNSRPTPDGVCDDIPTIIKSIRDWATANPATIKAFQGWIVAGGYDDAQLKERRHPTADEADLISKDQPVMLIHASGHLGVLNHKGLERVGIDESSQDPPGGVIRRVPGTNKPNGVLEETAWQPIMLGMWSEAGSEGSTFLTLRGVDAYASGGFTTAEDARASKEAVVNMRKLAAEGRLKIDIVSYPNIQMAGAKWIKSDGGVSRDYESHFRVAGIKLCLDGSPQGKTAWLTQPYKTPPEGKPAGYLGYPALADKTIVEGYVRSAFTNGWQMVAHTNGDAAMDQYISVIEKLTRELGPADRRPVVIHAQTARHDQLDQMKSLGMIPTFFSAHTYYWGDWHWDETLGMPRAANISPTSWALRLEMPFTIHNDAPAVPPKGIPLLAATVNRVTRSGRVIGPEQRISAYDGLRALTIWGAYQHHEENLKGSIKDGKLADFVILSADPTQVDPMTIKDIEVLETIKEGKSVYKSE